VSCLSDAYSKLFHYSGVRKDKHVREHTVYDLRPPGAAAPVVAAEDPSPVICPTGGPVEPAVVARIEAVLASVLGPIAKHVVKQHAARAASAAELCQSLAELIPGTEERAGFVRSFAAVAGPAPTAMAAPMSIVGTPPGPAAAAAEGVGDAVKWEPAVLERARAALAVYVGPMARVMVNRAATKARTLKQLYDLLTSDIPSEGDREKFRKAIAAARGG
jgi:hypothetical protein